jgi:hypothetical protein
MGGDFYDVRTRRPRSAENFPQTLQRGRASEIVEGNHLANPPPRCHLKEMCHGVDGAEFNVHGPG